MKIPLKVLTAVLILCLPVKAGGQGTGTLRGQIVPARGESDLPGVVMVRIVGGGVHQVTYVSGAYFSFSGLPDGNYTISVKANGREETVTELTGWSADRSDLVVITIGTPTPDDTVPPAGKTVVDVKNLRIPKEAHEKLEKGLQCLNRADFEKARKYFEGAIKISPEFPEAHNNLGIAYLRQNRLEKAEEEFAQAVKIQPENATALKNLAYLCLSQGRPKEAIDALAKAVRLETNDPRAEMYRGEAYVATRAANRAKDHFLKAVSLEPALAHPHYRLGYIFLQEKEYDEALKHFHAFLKLNPPRGKEEVAAMVAKLTR